MAFGRRKLTPFIPDLVPADFIPPPMPIGSPGEPIEIAAARAVGLLKRDEPAPPESAWRPVVRSVIVNPDPPPTVEVEAADPTPGIVGPQDRPPEPETPEPESLTPRIPDPDEIGVSERRIGAAIASGRFPVEPSMNIIDPTKATRALRDITLFAIASRLLFRNEKNSTILTHLREAGFPMSDRTLERTLARVEFKDYYEQFRARMLAPIDLQIREDFKLAQPEAFNKMVSLMRSARSEKVQADMATTILRGGGGLRESKDTRNWNLDVPSDVMRALVKTGRIAAGEDDDDDDLPIDAVLVPPPPG